MGGKKKPLIVDGVPYPSVRAYCEEIGISTQAFYLRASRGTVDYTPGPIRNREFGTLVKIGETTYPSMRAASRELGVSTYIIVRCLDRGTPDEILNYARPK